MLAPTGGQGMATGFVWHELYMWHNTWNWAQVFPPGLTVQPGEHAENPETKRRLRNLVEVSGLLDQLTPIKPRHATESEIARFHTRDYIARIKRAERREWRRCQRADAVRPRQLRDRAAGGGRHDGGVRRGDQGQGRRTPMRWCGRRDIMPSPTSAWASACSATRRSRSCTRRRCTRSAASRSSTGTSITATARRRRSTTTRRRAHDLAAPGQSLPGELGRACGERGEGARRRLQSQCSAAARLGRRRLSRGLRAAWWRRRCCASGRS